MLNTLYRIEDFRFEQENKREQEERARRIYKAYKSMLLHELVQVLNYKKNGLGYAFAASLLFSFFPLILSIAAAVMKHRNILLSKFALAFNIITLIPCLPLTLVCMVFVCCTSCLLYSVSDINEECDYLHINDLLSNRGLCFPKEVGLVFCKLLIEDMRYLSYKARNVANCCFIITLMMCVGLCIGISDAKRGDSNNALSNVSKVHNAILVSIIVVLLVLDTVLVMGRFEYASAKPVYNPTYGGFPALSYQPLKIEGLKEETEVVY